MIFNLFKYKPTLRDLVEDGFVDIHSHILPGLDDGPKNINESEELISQMKKLGFSKIYATPHIYPGLYDNNKQTIKKSFDKLEKHKNKDLIIDYASEYLIETSITELAEKNTLLTLKGKYVLVEMSYVNAPYNLFEIIFQLRINNYIPILAHPERYRFWYNDFSKFEKLKKMGCKFQLNLLSLTGYYGNDVAKVSEKLIKKGYINFLGSDIHNLSHIDKFNDKVIINSKLDNLKKIIRNNDIFL